MPRASLVWIVLTWIVSRLIAVAGTLSGAIPGDIALYATWSQQLAAGSFPVGDREWQYPPGAALLLWALGSDPDGYYRRFTLAALVADAAIMAIILILLRKRPTSSPWGAWIWAGAGFVIGPLLLQRYDVFPTVIAVAALALITRPYLSSAVSGIGLIVKVWPVIVLLGLPRRLFWRGALVAAAAAGAVWMIAALLFDGSEDFLRQQMGRGLEIEAAAALPFMIVKATGGDIEVRGRFGSWEIVSPLADTVATTLTALMIALILVLVVARLSGRLEVVPAGDVVLLALLLFVVANKVNSPQFTIWIAGIASIALLDRRSSMIGPVGLLILMTAITTQVIWPQFESLMTGNELIVGYQTLRIGLLLAATFWAIWNVLITSNRYASGSGATGFTSLPAPRSGPPLPADAGRG